MPDLQALPVTEVSYHLASYNPASAAVTSALYCSQAVLVKMGGWVTCMSYAASTRVGDFGTLYAADAAAAIVKINPCIVDGPNVWKETSQIQWRLTGTVSDAKIATPLAFRSASCVLLLVLMPLLLLPLLLLLLVSVSWITMLMQYKVQLSYSQLCCQSVLPLSNGMSASASWQCSQRHQQKWR